MVRSVPLAMLPALVASMLVAAAVVRVVDAVPPRRAPQDTPWEELEALLSDPNILRRARRQQWADQCIAPFVRDDTDGFFAVVSNYELLDQPSGLCMDHASCAYKDCLWPFPPSTSSSPFPAQIQSPFVIFPPFDDGELYEDQLNLPAYVLNPNVASDIVHAVKFCEQYGIGITVKVAGHSYFGASTARGTLLIKMSTNYPTYGIDGSLTECMNLDGNDMMNTTDAGMIMACDLAVARNKSAVLRVGGGELFDEAYRAVSIEWNENNPDSKYHLVGGGAGTVSAAGGWLASGGLSGTTGMRMYGIGIDQVLHMEMVLPSGAHVRFGPSEWTMDEGSSNEYPTTTKVTGYCNARAGEIDETLWEWTDCEEDINFDDLWFAARGGGGGTYGIVTSLYYQLHDYPGELHLVTNNPAALPQDFMGITETNRFVITVMYIRFIILYLYNPSELGVSEEDSRGCGSAQTASLFPFGGGAWLCYGNAAFTFTSKWQEYILEPERVQTLMSVGWPQEIVESFAENLIFYASKADSYTHLGLVPEPGVPEGRLPDYPRAGLVPLLGSFPNYIDSMHTHFPIDLLVDQIDIMAEKLAADVLARPGSGVIYTLGGAVPFASDGMNSLSPTRRHAGFLRFVTDEPTRDDYYSLIYGNLDPATDDFPGSSCHNHALVFEYGPQKADWTKSCPIEWSNGKREEDCISQNEASWGTANLARLESIKAVIDPNNLFICTSGVGYTSPRGGMMMMPTDEMNTMPNSPAAPTNESPVMPPSMDDPVMPPAMNPTMAQPAMPAMPVMPPTMPVMPPPTIAPVAAPTSGSSMVYYFTINNNNNDNNNNNIIVMSVGILLSTMMILLG